MLELLVQFAVLIHLEILRLVEVRQRLKSSVDQECIVQDEETVPLDVQLASL